MAIVSTTVAAIPEIVRHSDTGLTVPTGDAGALTAALRDLATNSDLRLNLGARAVNHVTRNFDARTNADRLLELLKSEADVARRKGLEAVG